MDIVEPTKQQNERYVRKLGMIEDGFSESIDKDETDDFSKDKAHHYAQSRFCGMDERENIDSVENKLE